MVKRVEHIVEQALGLTESDRETLIRRLIDSLGPEGLKAQPEQDEEIERAWAEEIARRVHRMERGEEKMIPGDQVRAQARKIVDG